MSNSTFRHLYTDSLEGQSIVKNYIKNAYASENVNGWATYADAAQSTPVNGTGGSPNVTLTRNTSSPLRNEADFLLTKDAANRQGQGASYDFSIDKADINKQLSISMDYSASAAFVTGQNSDVQVFLYDVTNTVLIPVSRGSLLTSPGFFAGTFQASNSQSYRLIFHVATTNASAWTLEFTNVEVNTIQTLPQGPIVTDWQSYTPTFTGCGTVSNTNIFYRRVGDTLYTNGYFTTGTVSGSNISVSLPTGLLIDTTKFGTGTNNQKVGELIRETFSSQNYAGDVTGPYPMFYDGSAADVIFVAGGTSSNNLTKANGSALFSSGDIECFNFSVPIAGWTSGVASISSSNLVMSQILANGTRVTTSPAAIGEYRSLYRASTSTLTLTDTAPSAGIITAANGIQIVSTAYNTAGTSGQPGKYEIFIGYNKIYQMRFYASTGRTGLMNYDYFSNLGTNDTGSLISYDPTTGILIIDVLNVQSVSNTSRYIGQTQPEGTGDGSATSLNTAYFDVIVSDNDFQIQLNSPFKFFASSAITTNSSDITSGTFTTFSNSPAFTFIPSVTGTYKVYTSATLRVTASGVAITKIFNTSGSAGLLYESQTSITNSSATFTFEGSLYTQSIYTLTSGTSYVFDIQGKADGSHAISLNGSSASFYMFAELCG